MSTLFVKDVSHATKLNRMSPIPKVRLPYIVLDAVPIAPATKVSPMR